MTLQKSSLRLAALGCISMLAACTGGQSGSLPAYQSVNVPATTKLQFSVGTANYAGTAALNTVATFRQISNGLSATLLNTPSIVGPAGFTVPAVASAGNDGGTNSITATPQTLPGLTPAPTTFGQSIGVFAYGFAPLNSTTNGPPNPGGFSRQPFYSASQMRPVLGPPATPDFHDGNTASSFVGYPSGFASFAGVALVPGTYTLNVLVPSADPKLVSNLTAAGTLTSTALLPTFAAPTFASDGAGGGTGPQTVVIPALKGPSTPKGGATQTLTPGDSIFVTAVGFDYPAFESAPPGNVSATPTIVGANGQADLTASPITAGTE